MKRVLLSLPFILFAVTARAGAPLAGMGGVGIGIGSNTADISDNAAASTADLRRSEGAMTGGIAWRRLEFSGGILNRNETTRGAFDATDPVDWSFATPSFGRGRLAAGAWEVDRRGVRLMEPLDLTLAITPGGSPLSSQYWGGTAYLKEDEGTYAVGAEYVWAIDGGNHAFSVGGAWLMRSVREVLGVGSEPISQEGVFIALRTMERREELAGPGLLLGYFFRPVPGGSVGLSALLAGQMTGQIWEVEDGGPLRDNRIHRAPQARFGAGGSLTILENWTAALDLRYSGGVSSEETLFFGTPAERKATETADSTFSAAAGVEYRLRFPRWSLPVRAGFYTKPDPAAASTAGLGADSVKELVPASFKQDLMAVTLGTGFEGDDFRADIALMWLLVDTRIKLARPAGAVESGDTRNSIGAAASISMMFGGGE